MQEYFFEKLENACLYEFRHLFGEVPRGNVAGSKTLELTDEKRYFNFDRIDEVLRQLSQLGT